MPELPADATPEAVSAAIDALGFTDAAALKAAIGGDAAKFNGFSAWSRAVKGRDGNVAAHGELAESRNLAASWRLGAETLFKGEPAIAFSGIGVGDAGQPGLPGSFEVAVSVRDGADAAMVSAAKVAEMFEATGSLDDWEGDARLAPNVSEPRREADGTLRFTVTPGDGSARRAFIRIRAR